MTARPGKSGEIEAVQDRTSRRAACSSGRRATPGAERRSASGIPGTPACNSGAACCRSRESAQARRPAASRPPPQRRARRASPRRRRPCRRLRPRRAAARRTAASSALAESARSRRESTSVPSRSKTKRRIAHSAVLGERRRRLPHRHSHDRQALLARVVGRSAARCVRRSDCSRAVIHRLAELLQGHQRIVMAQQHLVIELAIDPPLTMRLMSLKSQTMLRLSSCRCRTSISATALWPCGCLQMPS